MHTALLRPNAVLRVALALLVFLTSFVSAFAFIYRDRIFLAPSSILVYGTESCSITKALRLGLEKESVPYVFVNVDGPFNFQEMQRRLGVGTPQFKGTSIRLPVVYQAGIARERPQLTQVLQVYAQAGK